MFKYRSKDTTNKISEETGRDPTTVNQRSSFATLESIRAIMKKTREGEVGVVTGVSMKNFQTEGEV